MDRFIPQYKSSSSTCLPRHCIWAIHYSLSSIPLNLRVRLRVFVCLLWGTMGTLTLKWRTVFRCRLDGAFLTRKTWTWVSFAHIWSPLFSISVMWMLYWLVLLLFFQPISGFSINAQRWVDLFRQERNLPRGFGPQDTSKSFSKRTDLVMGL